MEVGRRLGLHIRRGKREAAEAKKRGYIDKFIPHIGIALKEILNLKDKGNRPRGREPQDGPRTQPRNMV